MNTTTPQIKRRDDDARHNATLSSVSSCSNGSRSCGGDELGHDVSHLREAALFETHGNELSSQTLMSSAYGRDIYSGACYHKPLHQLLSTQSMPVGVHCIGLEGLRANRRLLTLPVTVGGKRQTTPVPGANGAVLHLLKRNRGKAPRQKPGQALEILSRLLEQEHKATLEHNEKWGELGQHLYDEIETIALALCSLPTATDKTREQAMGILGSLKEVSCETLTSRMKAIRSAIAGVKEAVEVHRARRNAAKGHHPTTEDTMEMLFPLPSNATQRLRVKDPWPTRKAFLKQAEGVKWNNLLFGKVIVELVRALPEEVFANSTGRGPEERRVMEGALTGFRAALRGPLDKKVLLSLPLPLEAPDCSEEVQRYFYAVDCLCGLLQALKPFEFNDWVAAVYSHVNTGLLGASENCSVMQKFMGVPIWSTHGMAALNIALTAAPGLRLEQVELGGAIYYEIGLQRDARRPNSKDFPVIPLTEIGIRNEPDAYKRVMVAGRCAETNEALLERDLNRLEATLVQTGQAGGKTLLVLDMTLEPRSDKVSSWLTRKGIVQEIEQGHLDIILIKSLQKYTTLGTGKTTGAYLLPISREGNASKLNRFFQAHHNGTSPVKLRRSQQIQTLFLRTGLERAFYEAAAANARALASKLGKDAFARGAFVFAPSAGLGRRTGPVMLGGIPIIASESFGSAITTATRIPSGFGLRTFIRVSPGITTEALSQFSERACVTDNSSDSDSFSSEYDWGNSSDESGDEGWSSDES